VLEDGYRYELNPGEAEMQRTGFNRHGVRLPASGEPTPSDRREALPTQVLLASGEPADYAELHWRLAMPLGGLFLALVAVPLARTSPRQGRYGRLFLGIVVYLVYSNLLATGQVWIERGQVAPSLGLWWCHGLLLSLTLGLLFVQTGGWRRWFVRRRSSERGQAA
jgi:lipopolysaccharide export system permease protein